MWIVLVSYQETFRFHSKEPSFHKFIEKLSMAIQINVFNRFRYINGKHNLGKNIRMWANKPASFASSQSKTRKPHQS